MKTVVYAIGQDLSEALRHRNFYTSKNEAQAYCDELNRFKHTYDHERRVFRVEITL